MNSAVYDLRIACSVPIGTDVHIAPLVNSLDIWVDAFSSAKTSIDLGMFYLCAGPSSTSESLVHALLGAARRGVRIRIIIDAAFWRHLLVSGESDYTGAISILTDVNNISVSIVDRYNKRGGSHHAKYFIVDGSCCWIGSNNFDWKSFDHIVELGVLVNNRQLAENLQDCFNEDWEYSLNDKCRSTRSEPARKFRYVDIQYKGVSHNAIILPTPTWNSSSVSCCPLEVITDAIENAVKSVDIQSRKFEGEKGENNGRWNRLLGAIRSASRRGVDVRLMFDSRLKDNAQRGAELYNFVTGTDVEMKLVRIPSYSSGDPQYSRMLHSKSISVDDNFSWIGSSNFTCSDFESSRNIGIAINGSAATKDVRKFFDIWWGSHYAEALAQP